MRILVYRLWRSTHGVTAIEFAVLAPVLFYFIFSAFEIGLIYVQRELLDRAVTNATKQIYIGTASSGQMDKEDLEDTICEDLVLAGSECRKDLTLELLPVSSLSNQPQTEVVCRDSSSDVQPTIGYNPGVRNDFMFMRVCYMKKLLMPGVGLVMDLQPDSNGRVALVSSSAFVNEPF